jgi:polyvinyl alcohol dehydrogenase (cytochrome)
VAHADDQSSALPVLLQAHPALETGIPFRLIRHWKRVSEPKIWKDDILRNGSNRKITSIVGRAMNNFIKTGTLLPITAVLCIVGSTNQLRAADRSGPAIFQTVCSGCHKEGSKVNAPLPAVLRGMPVQTIATALESGKMKTVGGGLSPAERMAVATYLGVPGAESIPQSAHCSDNPPLVASAPSWNGWGVDGSNSRFQNAQAAGLTAADVPKLKLKWAFGFPGVTTSFGTPTVFGGRVFVGSADGTVFSLNAQSGCIYWMFKATEGVRTAPIISSDGKIAYVADLHAWMNAINAQTGELIWRDHMEESSDASISGTPKLDGDRLYVPISGGEESVAAASPSFPCCKMRGSIAALDAKTGKWLWRNYTIPEPAKLTGKTSTGTETWGPSGASLWTSPTIDSKLHAVYAGTGINYSQPGTKTSDSIIAFDQNTGRILWSQQMLPGDVFNFGCTTEQKPNCPATPGGDLDIGSPPMLKDIGGGKRVLVVAAKSGMVYGLDPDQQGKEIWKTMAAAGGPEGGVIWGGSSDAKNAYFAISDWNPAKPEAGGGVVALDLATGMKVWSTPAPKPACVKVKGCSAAQPGPTSVIDGAVFAGSDDGHLRAYSTADGHILWDFDTTRDIKTVNGIKAHGGSMDSTGATIAGGMVYQLSGYSRIPVMPGNAFLAFSVDGK